MAHRTTLMLDDQTRQAARELASRYDCSTSEAIRRAVTRQHAMVFGIAPQRRRERRRERRKSLEKLFELFDGNDAEAEIRRLKAEDEGF